MTVFKVFIRTYLDYGNIPCDHALTFSHHKLKSLLDNTYLNTAGTTTTASKTSFCKKLDLKLLQNQRWFKKMLFLHNLQT